MLIVMTLATIGALTRGLSLRTRRWFLAVFFLSWPAAAGLSATGYGDMTNQRLSAVFGGALFAYLIPTVALGAIMSVVTVVRHQRQQLITTPTSAGSM